MARNTKSAVHLLVKSVPVGSVGSHKYVKRIPKPGGGFIYTYHDPKMTGIGKIESPHDLTSNVAMSAYVRNMARARHAVREVATSIDSAVKHIKAGRKEEGQKYIQSAKNRIKTWKELVGQSMENAVEGGLPPREKERLNNYFAGAENVMNVQVNRAKRHLPPSEGGGTSKQTQTKTQGEASSGMERGERRQKYYDKLDAMSQKERDAVFSKMTPERRRFVRERLLLHRGQRKTTKSFVVIRKAVGHRYVRREALAGGGFRYFYKPEAGRSKKVVVPPTLKSKPAREAYRNLIGTARITASEITRVMRRKPADRGSAQSLTMLWQMKILDEAKKAKSKGAPIEELRSLFDYMEGITKRMEAASKRKRGKGSTFESPTAARRGRTPGEIGVREAQRQATQKSMEANPMKELSLSEREGERIADAVLESEDAKITALVKASQQTPKPAGKVSRRVARPAKAAVAKSAEALAVEAAAPHCPDMLVKAVVEVPTYGQKTKKKTIPDDRVVAIFKAYIRTQFRNAVRWNEASGPQSLYDRILSSTEHSPITEAALGVLEKRKTPFSVEMVKACVAEVEETKTEGEGIAPTNSDAASVVASGG